MPIRWDSRNKRWRFDFDRVIDGRRFRPSRLLPKGWTQAQADAFDVKEVARLYAIATGVQQRDPLISEAVLLYLRDKTHLKSHRAASEHLAAISWAYTGRRMSELSKVAAAVVDNRVVAAVAGGLPEHTLSLSTARNRLALLKAAARWAWKKHKLVDHDPTAQMQLPSVNNARHTYIDRKQMLQVCRACTSWGTQIAIRVAFYAGLRLGEIQRAEPVGDVLLLRDTKNGDVEQCPCTHASGTCCPTCRWEKKRTVQKAWERPRQGGPGPRPLPRLAAQHSQPDDQCRRVPAHGGQGAGPPRCALNRPLQPPDGRHLGCSRGGYRPANFWQITPHIWRRERDSNPRYSKNCTPDFESEARTLRWARFIGAGASAGGA